jgi:hypothetical protein
MIGLPMAYHALGKRAESDAALAALIEAHARDSAYNIAYVQAMRGDKEAAFRWLRQAVDNRDTGLSDLVFEPGLASLHGAPRWTRLLRELGKSPAQLAAVQFTAAPPP